MSRRIRTAKSLGQRHDFHYFKRWTRGRWWRTLLGFGLPLIASFWLGGMALRQNNAAYSSGPMASVHAVFGKQCETCHQPQFKAGLVKLGFRQHVEDSACLTCHQAPLHQGNQTFTPKCGSCHLEHIGSPHLEQAADQTCTQCHADLKIKSGTPHYVTTVLGFNEKHPEFAPLRAGFRDPGTIKLNHAVHLKAGLKGPHMESVKLDCSDCHRVVAEMDRPWKYGDAKLLRAAMTSDSTHAETPAIPLPKEAPHPGQGRSYMAPPSYEKNCMGCHSLQFDRDIAESVPHGQQPQLLYEFIVTRLTQYIAQHPGAVHEPLTNVEGRIPRGPEPIIARNAAEWVKLRTAMDEELLWRKTCLQCHTLQPPDAGSDAVANNLPHVAPPNIKPVWLANSVFSHYAHVSVKCESCHAKAPNSQETSDVLLPGIASCQRCHNGKPEKFGAAQNGCFLCHQYHQWQNQEPIKGKYSIPELTASMRIGKLGN